MVKTASEQPLVRARGGVTFRIKALIGAESDMLDRIVSAVWADNYSGERLTNLVVA